MKTGYIRVSTEGQNLDVQRDKLVAAGCEKIFEEKQSGGNDSRPVLKEAMEYLRPGDIFVVADSSRFARSAVFFINTIAGFIDKGIGYESLDEPYLNISPGSEDDPMKEFLRTVVAAIAQLNRKLINVKVREGKAAARARGRVGGRPKHPVLSNPKSLDIIMNSYEQGMTVAEVCSTFNIKSQNTFYLYRRKWLNERGALSDSPAS